MFDLNNFSINLILSGGNIGFYILAWLPLVIIIAAAIRGTLQKKKDK